MNQLIQSDLFLILPEIFVLSMAASPDMGGSKRAYAYSKFLESDVVICYKQRKAANVENLSSEA